MSEETNIIQTPIIHEVEQSFLDYSLSVITDRAIPSAEDGLKPVARRILWDMYDKGYTNNKKFVKCAQPVGDTMGRFHPHGDSSIYGALVWLSQSWNMRYPLISFHGNNGSRDGDEAAAYRYTECKLSKMGEEMLADIKKDTTDWQLAYTDEEEEPVYLPGRIPNLLVNGTSGIAVAMACSFAPHNLNEIMEAAKHVLTNPQCKVEDLLAYVKGPDFPTGGLIVNKDELENAYLTGRGRVRIRGEYKIETHGKTESIVFTSIPYKVSKSELITEIDNLCEEKKINDIASIRDESGNGEVRFVIELEKDANAESIVNKLFKMSRLEDTFSINQIALVDKKPVLLNLKELLEIYIEHQRSVLLRKTQYDATKIENRIHILEGLLKALEDIDNIIAMIKKSESANAAKLSLQQKYNFSENQAKAILDMKLSKLAKLEKVEIQNEKSELETELVKLKAIIANPVPQLLTIFQELEDTYGDSRKSTITNVELSKIDKEIEMVEPDKCIVIMTEGGSIKRIPASSYHTQKRNGIGIKTQDDITNAIIRTNTIDSLMIFSNYGKMYRLLVNDIPEGTNSSKGQQLKTLISMEPNEKPEVIYSIYRDTEATYLLSVTSMGLIKRTPLEEYVKTKKKTGMTALKIKEGDSLAAVTLAKDETILLISKNGYVIRFETKDITPISRTAVGVKGMGLADDDEVIAALPVRDDTDYLAVFSEKGLSKKIKLSDIPCQNRGGKGIICYKPNLSTGKIVAASLVADDDSLLVMGENSSICVSGTDIPMMGRTAMGCQIIRGSKITSVTKI